MTVRELINVLERYSSDMRVVVDGYEQGYDDLSPEQISMVRIALDTGMHEWEGRHAYRNEVPADFAGQIETVDALVLRRVSN
ncbi:MAG: hypothetical protein OXJ37_11115 [Bryobacterales bacterium]|nr:hypothetical protein [Bryobacterales bacterium]